MNGIIPELTERFKGLRRCAICFSGGLDSTVLLRNASESIHGDFIAVFVRLPMNSDRQVDAAFRIAGAMGIILHIIYLSWDDLRELERNGPDRCYHCKKAIYKAVKDFSDVYGLRYIIAGDNADDPESERPGSRAGQEMGVICPLKELGVGRQAVIDSIQEMELPVKMIKDTCMATRYSTGVPINEEKMRFAEECEGFVRSAANVDQIRVRINMKEALLQTDLSELHKLKNNLPSLEVFFAERGMNVRIDEDCYRNV